MENQIITQDNHSLTAKEIKAQVNLIQEVMKSVMKKDIHYGIIPGCKKPSLWKPGAEKILMTFRLVADNPIISDLSTEDVIRYRVTQRILDTKGNLIGSASGECSSGEDKYKWRKPVCDEEFDETPEDRRMEKWIRGYDGKNTKIKRVRTNPADVGNTILKMAIKRALIAVTLTSTAASDVFDQDLEDIPAEILQAEAQVVNDKPEIKQPTKKEKPAEPVSEHKAQNPISEPQAKRLYAIAKGSGYEDQDIKDYLSEHYGISSSREIEKEFYEDIVAIFQVKKDKDA